MLSQKFTNQRLPENDWTVTALEGWPFKHESFSEINRWSRNFQHSLSLVLSLRIVPPGKEMAGNLIRQEQIEGTYLPAYFFESLCGYNPKDWWQMTGRHEMNADSYSWPGLSVTTVFSFSGSGSHPWMTTLWLLMQDPEQRKRKRKRSAKVLGQFMNKSLFSLLFVILAQEWRLRFTALLH